jgi:hypothetical protein
MYDENLYAFVSSIAWRVCRYRINTIAPQERHPIGNAASIWKCDLNSVRLGRRAPGLRGCTHHCLIDFGVIDGHVAFGKTVGYDLDLARSLIVWRIGPLVTFSLLRRHQLKLRDIRLLGEWELKDDGGMIHEVRREDTDSRLPSDFVAALRKMDDALISRAKLVVDDDESI